MGPFVLAPRLRNVGWLATGVTTDDPFKIKYGDRTEDFTPVAVIDYARSAVDWQLDRSAADPRTRRNARSTA